MMLRQLRELPIHKWWRSGSLRKGMRGKQSLPTVQLAKVRSSHDQVSVKEIFSDFPYLKDPQGMVWLPKCWMSTWKKT